MTDAANRIRELNDAFRTNLLGGTILLTPGISELPPDVLCAVLDAIRQFDAFTEDDDPYGEHDFGALTVAGSRIFWKIDCYDPSMRCEPEDTTDTTRTVRVLTVMLAEEY